MTPTNEAEQLARQWIQGWMDGQPDQIPLAEDFVHSSPFGVVRGRERYLNWVKPLAEQNVASLEIIRVIGREGEAVVWFENLGPSGLIPTCDWVQIEGGEITSVTSFYDASRIF